MSVFDSLNETSNDAIDRGERYLHATRNYFKLKLFQQISLSVNIVTLIVLVGGSIFLGLIFFSIAGAILLGKILDSLPLGYLLVGLIFLLIGFVLYLLRKKIESIVIKKVSNTFFD